MKSIQQKLTDAEAILKEVKSLRTMQKEYFKYLETDTLNKCKLQEKKIDAMIEEYWPAQPKLF